MIGREAVALSRGGGVESSNSGGGGKDTVEEEAELCEHNLAQSDCKKCQPPLIGVFQKKNGQLRMYSNLILFSENNQASHH